MFPSSQNLYVCSDFCFDFDLDFFTRFDFDFWFSSQGLYTFVLTIANLTKFLSQHPFVLAIVMAHKACIRSPCLLLKTHIIG